MPPKTNGDTEYKAGPSQPTLRPDGTGNQDTLIRDNPFGNLRAGRRPKMPLPERIGKFTLYFKDN